MACATGIIQYGSLNLTALGTPINSSVSSIPMKSDDGIGIKYWKTTIEVEFVLTIDPDYLDSLNINSVDESVELIKSILSKRGLPLTYSYRGYGFVITTPNDIVYGPFPEILEWSPIAGNRSVRLKWKVTVATLNCGSSGGNPTIVPSLDNPNQFLILQVTEDSNLSFDEEGALTIRTNGTVEVAADSLLTRQKLRNFVKWYFPNELVNFQRTIDISLRKDLRTIDYRVTDTEIKSDNPYYPYIIKMDVKHSMQSSLFGEWTSGSGFKSWANEMNGAFTVRPGEWKGWAWVAFLHIVAQRRNRSSATVAGNGRVVKDANDAPEGDDADAARKARKVIQPKQFPLSLKIEESLYSREVNIAIRWVTVCSLFDLFKSTGMFYPVHTTWDGKTLLQSPDTLSDSPKSPQEQWTLWRASANVVQNLNGNRNVQLPNFSLLFDVCSTSRNDLSTNIRTQYQTQEDIGSTGFEINDTGSDEMPPLGNMTADAGVNGSSSLFMDGIKKENSWLTYKNSFQIVEDSNAEYIPTIENVSLATLNSGLPQLVSTIKNQSGHIINGNTVPPLGSGAYTDEVIAVKGKPLYKIRMSGYAIRIGWQIPAPVLQGASPDGTTVLNAFRIGNQKWSHDILTVSEEVPVFIAKWSQMYALPFDPSGPNIKFSTSGNPAEFI